MRALAGAIVVAAHAIAFILLAPTCTRPELVVELTPAGPVPSVAEVEIEHVGCAGTNGAKGCSESTQRAGALAYTRWTAHYRGGFARSVGFAQLDGPRQDPDAHACVGRVVVGQQLLDDGHASPGTFAGELVRVLDAELRADTYVGLGAYRKLANVSLHWAQLAEHPEDILMVYAAPNGYVRATATIVFDRVEVPLTIALILEPTPQQLQFRIVARAALSFDNRVLQWLSDKLGGNRLATRLARDQIDQSLVTALSPPPPFELPGGQQLVFGYCAGRAEIVDGAYGALPFSVALGRVPGAANVLPPRRGPAVHGAVPADTQLAVDVDLDGLDAILYELWRSHFLDRRLAAAGLDKRFNEDPTVQEFLSLRITPPVLALPPTLAANARGGLSLFADARIAIRDGDATTVGRVWGGLDFTFAARGLDRPSASLRDVARPDNAGAFDPVGVDLGALELTCERTPTTLVPCYADLVAALRDRGAQFHGELTKTFGSLLTQIFVDRRLHGVGMPADLVIRAASPSVTTAAGNGSLRLQLAASLVRSP